MYIIIKKSFIQTPFHCFTITKPFNQEMLRPCRHKLAFSKKNWYANALKAVIPEKKKLWNAFNSQYRATATLATAQNPSADITISRPALAPLEPLIHHEPKPLDEYRRCSGFKKYDGQQCRRFVRTDASVSPSMPVFCFNHDPDRKLKKRKKYEKKRDIVDIRAYSSEIEETEVDENLLVPVKERDVFKPPTRIYDCWNCKWIVFHIQFIV
jgi:hypothetical protein